MSWTVDLLNVCTGAYPRLSKLSVSLKLRRGLCLAGFHVVAQTQGYYENKPLPAAGISEDNARG